MSIKQEIKNLRSYIHHHKNYVNDFGGWGDSMENFPSISKIMQKFMSENDYEFFDESVYSTIGRLNFQLWNVSVSPHKDRTSDGEFFLICPVEMRKKSYYEFDQRPVFSYTDQKGKKVSEPFVEEKCVVFNPRYSHSVVYYGDDYLIALVSVKKVKT